MGTGNPAVQKYTFLRLHSHPRIAALLKIQQTLSEHAGVAPAKAAPAASIGPCLAGRHSQQGWRLGDDCWMGETMSAPKLIHCNVLNTLPQRQVLHGRQVQLLRAHQRLPVQHRRRLH